MTEEKLPDYADLLFNEKMNAIMNSERVRQDPPEPKTFLERLAFRLSCRVSEKHLDRLLDLPAGHPERQARMYATDGILDAFPGKYSSNRYYNSFVAFNLVYLGRYLFGRIFGAPSHRGTPE